MSLLNVLRGPRRRSYLLGGLLTGGAGAALLGTALRHLLKRSRDKRLYDKADGGAVSPDEVEAALGEDRIQWLIRQTGLTRDELLAGLRFSREIEPERFRRYS
jgi:uncharacterized protein YidB (DUF937 family)